MDAGQLQDDAAFPPTEAESPSKIVECNAEDKMIDALVEESIDLRYFDSGTCEPSADGVLTDIQLKDNITAHDMVHRF